MKIGDIVRWLGFPGANAGGISATGPGLFCYGIIVKVKYLKKSSSQPKPDRIDVMWSKGSIGKNLYPQTVEVINESNRFGKN